MTESELLKKLKGESRDNVPDPFDEIVSSAQGEGLIKPSNAKKIRSARASGSGAMKSKIHSINRIM